MEADTDSGGVMKAAAVVGTLGALVATAVAWWRFDRRAARLVVLEAQRIADDESARLLRMGHPSMWGRA